MSDRPGCCGDDVIKSIDHKPDVKCSTFVNPHNLILLLYPATSGHTLPRFPYPLYNNDKEELDLSSQEHPVRLQDREDSKKKQLDDVIDIILESV